MNQAPHPPLERQAEGSYKLLVESIRDYAVFMLDPGGYINSWNPGAERIKGWRADEIIGQHFSRFYPDEDLRAGKCEMELEVAARTGRFEDEGWRLRKDGTRFWANVIISAIRSPESGELIGYSKVTRDLTERKQAEEQLRESEERFRLLIESVADYAIFMLDPEGVVTSWNNGAQRINGYRAEEIIGQHFSRFYTEEDVRAGKCDLELRVAAQTGRFEDEGWRIRKDGTHIWANVIITALRDPKTQTLIGFAKVTRDLTERRSAEEALRRSEERFRLIVETVGDYAIFMLDPKGVVSTWNRGAERINGYRAEEIIGQHFSRFYPEEDVRAGKCDMELRVATETGRFEDEGWRIRKDATRIWANVIITALRDPKTQKLIGFVKVTRDLTERKNAEEQRVELARAREAVRLRDEFISIASHELRTPLSTLRIQSDGIARALRKGGLEPDRLVGKVEMVRAQVTRLERLVTSLLDVSRIEVGRLVLDTKEMDLAELVRDTVHDLGDELERAGCTLTVDASHPIIGVWDRNRLDQVLTNLLTNAAKYGGGKPIEVTLESDDERARFSVRDRGIGIDPEHHQRIFERFERAVDNKHFGGIGLGLWLSNQIVQLHGGQIHVDSQLGAGSTFTVELPRGTR
jgi:PAS domain S-box-containing protein